MKTLLVVSLVVIGAGIGFAGDMLFWRDASPTPGLGSVGLLVGLLVGWALARQMGPRRPKRRIDPRQYSNRVIRRRDEELT